MPRKSPTDIATDPLHMAIMGKAHGILEHFSDEQLLRRIADTAPAKRNRFSTHAQIPWEYIYAIRLRYGGL